MDPQNRANLWDHVSQDPGPSEAGTIVLTTHYLDEADTMAERVVVERRGAGSSPTTPRNASRYHGR